MKDQLDKKLEKSAKYINKANRFVAVLLAVMFFLYGGFSLWDMYRSEFRAFASYELMQYKPSVKEDPPYLEELKEMNPDVCAWLTIDNTRIDYPVVQGKDDMEYVNKDASGNYAMWGSLFVSQLNKNDFSDSYNLIYGHHVNNGTMFGDIEKYKDRQFFENSKEGVLVLSDIVYDLRVFAFLETDAYDPIIYNPDNTDVKMLKDYLHTNAIYYEEPEANKVLALSTCQNDETNGRMIVFCEVKERTKPYFRKNEPRSVQRKAIGHPMEGAYWAILNMVCMLFTIYTAFPLHMIKKKKWRSKEFIIEIFLAVASAVLFYATENPHKPMQMTDKWTPFMIVLFLSCWLISAKTNGVITGKKKTEQQKREEV